MQIGKLVDILIHLVCVLIYVYTYIYTTYGSRDSVLGIATGYWVDGQEVGVRFLVGSRIFSSPHRPDRFWAHPSFYPMDTGGSFPEGKATGA
jgi:hypothetical protein